MMNADFFLLPLILGSGLIAYGIYRLKKYAHLQHDGLRCDGTIYEIITERTHNIEGPDSVNYYLSVGFLTDKSVLIVKKIDVTLDHWRYKKGDNVCIIYDSASPEEIMLDKGEPPFYTYFLWLFPGAMCMVIGVWMWYLG